MEKKLIVSSVKRVHGRADLILSNGEVLSMPRSMLKERPYRGGMPFDRQLFDVFIQERSYAFGLEKAIALLASRARTEKEIVDCLKKNAYPEAAIARIMARLQEAGYIDDADFAEQWTAARISKGLGARRIRMELLQKGVSQEDIDETLSAVNEKDMMASALKAAQKAARGKDLSTIAARQKIIVSLVRHGFDFSTARTALNELMKSI